MTIILTCSGISNTGKLTTQVAIALMRHLGEDGEWIKARDSPARIAEAVSMDDQVIVIEGCTDHCAAKKLKEYGILPSVHVVATELGIRKNGMEEPKYEEIEVVIRQVKEKILANDKVADSRVRQ
jgi:uncharacterized metal-binding protein